MNNCCSSSIRNMANKCFFNFWLCFTFWFTGWRRAIKL